jgi:uncharacterized radical SAM protein YgiQ
MSKQEMDALGWDECDIILVTGDAYVDHHSYGVAVIGRVLEGAGYRVGIIAQPDWRNTDDFKKLGAPRLFFGITSGNIDSMLANYTGNKHPRKTDVYSPRDKAGMRPDRAVTVYANRVREAYKNEPLVLGGIEASMRRLAHYDYWSDSVRRSLILDTRADILVYGMGERQIVEIADRLKAGEKIGELNNINGTVVVRNDISFLNEHVNVPSYEEVSRDKNKFNEAFRLFYDEQSPCEGRPIVQQHANRFVVQFPPALPLSETELDKIYELPYARDYHPSYAEAGGIKGFEIVQNSIVSHRGCPGECNFCGLGAHQGRIVQSRSERSVLNEAKKIAAQKYFHGTINDVGGPTANLYKASCLLWTEGKQCKAKNCLLPQKCKNLVLGYDESVSLLKALLKTDKVKHVFVSSGVRYDLLVEPYADRYLEALCENHISGQLKVAPEHVSSKVLKLMNKPEFSVYKKFKEKFDKTNDGLGKDQYLVNYFISSHPGASFEDAVAVGEYCRKINIQPEQIQDYTPLSMTASSCMYYTGNNPFTGEAVFTAKSEKERNTQRALIQRRSHGAGNRKFVKSALRRKRR